VERGTLVTPAGASCEFARSRRPPRRRGSRTVPGSAREVRVPLGAGPHPGETYRVLAPPHRGPVRLREALQGVREEDALLHEDHGPDSTGEVARALPRRPRVPGRAGLFDRLEGRADLVVLPPHDPGGSREARALQVGEELVLLPLVVDDERPELGEGLADRIGAAQRGPGEPARPPGRFPVLGEVGVDGMARHALGPPSPLEPRAEHVGVHLAEPLDLLDGSAALDQGLLERGHLGRVRVPDELVEFPLDLAWAGPGGEPLDYCLQPGGAVGIGLGQILAHALTPPPSWPRRPSRGRRCP